MVCLQWRAGNGGLCAFCMYSMYVTNLVLGALGLLFLNVHGQHLTAEREALGLLNHLLVRWYGIVPHDHMALEIWRKMDNRFSTTISQSHVVLQTHHPTKCQSAAVQISFTSTVGTSRYLYLDSTPVLEYWALICRLQRTVGICMPKHAGSTWNLPHERGPNKVWYYGYNALTKYPSITISARN